MSAESHELVEEMTDDSADAKINQLPWECRWYCPCS